MTRVSLVDEVTIVRGICLQLGLGVVEPQLVKVAHHTTFRLSPHPLVARVQSAEALDVAQPRGIRELAVARHLADRGASVLPPLIAALAGPHVVASTVVTLWPYVEDARTATDADAALAAASLATVHQGLLDYHGDLPMCDLTLDRCWALLDHGAAAAALGRNDRDLLSAQFLRLRREIDTPARRCVPLHGDVHLGNLLLTKQGATWIDFEDACLGPREIDIAGLPRAVWHQFRDADRALIERCADLKSVCVAIWCWADVARSAATREAAEYHLGRVRSFAP